MRIGWQSNGVSGHSPRRRKNIALNAKVSWDQYQTILSENGVVIISEISGTKITLAECHVKPESFHSRDHYVYVLIIPSKIIIEGFFLQNLRLIGLSFLIQI